MALISKKSSDDKQPAKKRTTKPATRKRGAATKKVASIADVNKATSAVQEEPTDQPVVQKIRTKKPEVESLTGDKKTAYDHFSTKTHSEDAAEQRKKSASSTEVDEYADAYDVGVIYADENDREFYYDEYGAQHFADEVVPSPEIPESFEEARNSESRERFRKEAEQVRKERAESVEANFDSVISDPRNTQGGFGGSSGGGYPSNGNQSSGDNGYAGNGQGYNPGPADNNGFNPQPSQPNVGAPTGFGQSDGQGFPITGGVFDEGFNPNASRRPQGGSNRGVTHAVGTDTVNLSNAEHVDNPYLEGSEIINDQIDQGTVAENFPSIATTIASLVNSSKRPDEITRTLLGYLQTTLAGEGIDATIKLLGTENIYAPLLVSALSYNLQQRQIDAVRLRDLWDIRPEVQVQEKIVYVKDNSTPRDGEKGYWISLEDVSEETSPLFDTLDAESKANEVPLEDRLNYSRFDY